MSETQNPDATSVAQEDDDPNSISETSQSNVESMNITMTEEPKKAHGTSHEANQEGYGSEEDEVNDETPVYIPFEPPSPIPLPNFTQFSFSIPEAESEDMEELEEPKAQPRTLVAPPDIIHVPDLLKPLEGVDSSPSLQGIEVVHLGKEAGLLGNMQATYLRLPPGTRTNRMSQNYAIGYFSLFDHCRPSCFALR